MHQPGAVVLGGNFVGLGVVRSLGAQGIPVWVVDSDRSKSIAQYSRYTKRFIESSEEAQDILLREARRHAMDGWVVFPTNDEYVEQLSIHHDSLSQHYKLITPPTSITRYALDKRLTYRRAAELGIDAPWTCSGQHVEDIKRQNPSFPVILKPAINHRFFPRTNLKALRADSAEILERRFAQMCTYIPPEEILVQECIPGTGKYQYSFCALCSGGRVLASLVAKRRRQYPIEFGNASTFVHTANQPVVEAAGKRFLESIGYDGMGEVEFKLDSRDGKYKILDVNLRPWGWHTLGKAAGADFAYLLWRIRTGLEASPGRIRQATWLREITDLVAILKSQNSLSEIGAALGAVFKGRFTLATFSALDPLPFFAELALWSTSGFLRHKRARRVLQVDPSDSYP